MKVLALLLAALGLTGAMVHKPQLKAAKKASRNRPKKKSPADRNRRPPEYNVEPQYFDGRPDEITLVSEGSDAFSKADHIKVRLPPL